MARRGMLTTSGRTRAGFYLAAAAVLFAHGWPVNRPPWSFGSLLGVYVVLFFVISQVLAWIIFGEKITRSGNSGQFRK
jgi:hypothetical protein